jgi:UDPglucose 6-dehydrogenase
MDICIVGTGYVGLVTAACFAEMGNTVVCVDVNPTIIENLQKGKIHIFEPGLAELVYRNASQGRLFFTTNFAEAIKDKLFIFCCVGTPEREDGTANMEFVEKVARDIGKSICEYAIIVNKSTVPVGTADRVRHIIQEELNARDIQIEFDVVSNPEFLKEGDAINDFMKPDRIVIGTDNIRTAELLRALYAPYARSREKLMVMGVRSAEMTKYAANCMLATKISFINEIANICERVGADVAEVRHGIGADHRIGYHFIYPGVGYGGSCFPKDVKALVATARQVGYHPQLLTAVDEVNERQKYLLALKIEDYFTPQGGVEDKTLALWGLAFKPNTDDMRQAPSLAIIQRLTAAGMRIRAYDPVAGSKARAMLASNPLLEILDDAYSVLKGAHALAVVTEWNEFRNPDFQRIKKALRAPIIFDGRNLYDPKLLGANGFAYFGIGRTSDPTIR